MKSSMKTERAAVTVTISSLLTVLLTALAASAASDDSSGDREIVLGPFAKTIEGTVYDDLDTKVGGVSIVVEMWVGEWPWNYGVLSGVRSTVSDAWGNYDVTFSANEWSPHYVIEIVGTKGSTEWHQNAEADGEAIQTVDLDFSYNIPELSGSLTLAFAMLTTIAIVVFTTRKTRGRLGRAP